VTGTTTGVTTGAATGVAVVVFVGVEGVAVGVVLAGGVFEPPPETSRGRFGLLAAFAPPSDEEALSPEVVRPVTLVSTAATPDE
jgi:hypothetical protein